MRVRILGSAAGGGFPQWNCACSNCHKLRNGTLRGRPRTQTQLAFELKPGQWVLVNASPDLRQQLEATPCLHPLPDRLRHTPIEAVILTSGDLDGVLGLLLLREFQPLRVYATRSVRQILSANSIFAMLQREKPQATWCDITPGQYFEINGGDVRCLPISVAASFPEYVDGNTLGSLSPGEAVIALGIRSSATQHGLLFAPSVGQGNQPLLDEATRYDVVLWDGTFWSDDELIAVRGHGKKATEMGHLPLSGPQGALSSFPASQQQRLFIHINNTNPILDEGGQEYARIRAAGWEAAADGMELIL